MLTEIDFSAKYVCMFYFALCLDLLFFRSVCRVSFTCTLYQYVLGVRLHVLGVHMFMMSVALHVLHCFCMLTEILPSAENVFQPSMFVLFFSLRLYLFVFRSVCHVCFTCMLYKVYVLGVRMYVLGVRMFMVSVAACFALLLHAG